jgi:hypothetical protein
VEVAEVEADADRVEVAGLEDVEQVVGGSDFVLHGFEQEADPERGGEGLEVLDGGEGVVDGGFVPGRIFEAEVQDDGGEGHLLGGFEGALDLVDGGDAADLLGVDDVEIGRDMGRPLGLVGLGEGAASAAEVDGLVESSADVVGAEPGGELADGGGVVVIEVVARGEDFDVACAGGVEGVQQAGMQAVLEEDVSSGVARMDGGGYRGLLAWIREHVPGAEAHVFAACRCPD